MKIPKEFFIKGKLWTVEYKWGLRLNDQRVEGICDAPRRVIQLDRSTPKDDKWQYFLHELVHAILWEAHLTDTTGGVEGLVEEVICNAIADVFNSNFTMKWKRKNGSV